MANSSLSKPTRAAAPPSAIPEIGYTDNTAPEFRAYLARVRPMGDLGSEAIPAAWEAEP